MGENAKTNFIGQYFRNYVKYTGIDRKLLAKKLNFNYANNDRMLCAYFLKSDYLWKTSDIDNWCEALKIKKTTPIYKQLIEKAGKKIGNDN